MHSGVSVGVRPRLPCPSAGTLPVSQASASGGVPERHSLPVTGNARRSGARAEVSAAHESLQKSGGTGEGTARHSGGSAGPGHPEQTESDLGQEQTETRGWGAHPSLVLRPLGSCSWTQHLCIPGISQPPLPATWLWKVTFTAPPPQPPLGRHHCDPPCGPCAPRPTSSYSQVLEWSLCEPESGGCPSEEREAGSAPSTTGPPGSLRGGPSGP